MGDGNRNNEETRDAAESTKENGGKEKEMDAVGVARNGRCSNDIGDKSISEKENKLVEKYEEQIKKLKAASLVSSRREKRAKAALGKVLSGGDTNREAECMKVFNQLDEQNEQYVIEYKK